MSDSPDALLDLAAEICARYRIADLEYFLESCRAFARADTLNVAVFGRFKAGKSSFLNHLLGQALLPVGVIPVTSVITEIEFGPRETAAVRYLDGRSEPAAPGQIADFVSETSNPGNQRRVASVLVEAPSMARYRGIRFVDTPGLHSVFEHNTGAATDWLPNTGLALVAVGVDPPLTQQDLDLIRDLRRFTPHISVLLTKVDTLAAGERAEVESFVHQQLARYADDGIAVFPYSIRPGFECLREQLDRALLLPARGRAQDQRAAILAHKAGSLLAECRGYLAVALKAAESADSGREQLRQMILGREQAVDDARLTLRLITRHAAAGLRTAFEDLLREDEEPLRQRLLAAFEVEFPAWTQSLAAAIDAFGQWLEDSMAREMAVLSERHSGEFAEPARRAGRQLSQSLQDFRNRLAEQTLTAFGVALRTTQVDLSAPRPRAPDIRVGRIFDHNWELLSFVAPMPLLRGAVKRHFRRKLADVVFMNLSRLASQWEEITGAMLAKLEADAAGRLDTLIATLEKLIQSAGQDAPRIHADIARLDGVTNHERAGSL